MTQYKHMQNLLSLQESVIDVNKHLTTIQGIQLTQNENGIVWNSELRKALSYFLPDTFRLVLDEDYAYILFENRQAIRLYFLIYGEKKELLMDFNSMIKIEKKHQSKNIVAIESEKGINGFFIIENPFQNESSVELPMYKNVLDAIRAYDNEVEAKKEQDWSISSFIETTMEKKGWSKLDLANETDVKYKTLINKFKINSITAEELLKMAILLDIDLNELKMLYHQKNRRKKVIPTEELIHITSLVQLGFMKGFYPNWELIVPESELYPLNQEERNQISKDIERGYLSGYLVNEIGRKWTLKHKIYHEQEE